VAATSGEQALKRIAARRPDLILLDLLMPGMDGFEVCRRIQENPDWANLPIIFVSAADDKELIVKALDSGGVDYVTKPFNKAELLSRVKTHLALKNAREKAERLAEDKDELLGILAHDLKNHLGGIQMSASLLAGSKAMENDARTRTLSENIQHSSERLLQFVAEFLANASADHGLCLSLVPVDLAMTATAATRDFSEMARRKEIQLICEIPGEPVMTHADSTCVEQVLDNLLSNALKFSPRGKNIYVVVSMGENEACCSVRDEGPGFQPQDAEKMFRRYGRLSARPTGDEPSTGLGLSIVKKMMDAMGGRLTCESKPGEGATLTFILPRSPHVKP
jgi:two-component system sensor histidine kinase/response regulator